MAILNEILKGEGNKAYHAHALLLTNTEGTVAAGDQLEVQVESFDGAGGSLGTQGLVYAAPADTDIYSFMKDFTTQIREGWDPVVNCWASQVTRNTVRFCIQPKGSPLDWRPTEQHELVRIIAFVWTPLPPTP